MCSSLKNNILSIEYRFIKKRLEKALNGYNPENEIKQGRARCFIICGAAVLLRIEKTELVIVAFDGKNKLKAAAVVLLNLAKTAQLKTIRLHTHRRGEFRYLKRLGYSFKLISNKNNEYIMRLTI